MCTPIVIVDEASDLSKTLGASSDVQLLAPTPWLALLGFGRIC